MKRRTVETAAVSPVQTSAGICRAQLQLALSVVLQQRHVPQQKEKKQANEFHFNGKH